MYVAMGTTYSTYMHTMVNSVCFNQHSIDVSILILYISYCIIICRATDTQREKRLTIIAIQYYTYIQLFLRDLYFAEDKFERIFADDQVLKFCAQETYTQQNPPKLHPSKISA